MCVVTRYLKQAIMHLEIQVMCREAGDVVSRFKTGFGRVLVYIEGGAPISRSILDALLVMQSCMYLYAASYIRLVPPWPSRGAEKEGDCVTRSQL